MRIRRLAATGAVLALSLGVVACNGGGEEPTAAPSTTAEETTEAATTEPAETSEAAPDVPKPDPADYPGKDEQTEEGAKQATRYYWAMLTWGYQTGDTQALEDLSTENCEVCIENLEVVRSSSSGDGRWGPVDIKDESITVDPSDSFDFVVQYSLIIGEHDTQGRKNEGRTLTPAARYKSANGVVWVEGAWMMDGVEFHSEEV